VPTANSVEGSGPKWIATQFYSGASVYCITPTTEAVARAVAHRAQPAPVQRWELAPALEAGREVEGDEDDNNDDDEEFST
jgi:hypothetical protein